MERKIYLLHVMGGFICNISLLFFWLPDFLPVIRGQPLPTMRMMHISTNPPLLPITWHKSMENMFSSLH
jgi:hypothetical protein